MALALDAAPATAREMRGKSVIVCEHTDCNPLRKGDDPYKCEIYYAETWEGSSGATHWCKEVRERFPDPARHKVYAYEVVKF